MCGIKWWGPSSVTNQNGHGAGERLWLEKLVHKKNYILIYLNWNYRKDELMVKF